MPLLEGINGPEKMSKSLGNYVGISEPPDTIFGKLMSISDALMWRYIELLSFEPIESVDKWKKEVREGSNPRDIKVRFAREIVARFHDARAAEKAVADFEARFKHGDLPESMPEITVTIPDASRGSPGRIPELAITKVLKESQLVSSTSEALRMIEQGGVRINGEKVADKALAVKRGDTVVLQVGKRKFARVTVN
jgi:tyrosyl-tRNA synthetase